MGIQRGEVGARRRKGRGPRSELKTRRDKTSLSVLSTVILPLARASLPLRFIHIQTCCSHELS